MGADKSNRAVKGIIALCVVGGVLFWGALLFFIVKPFVPYNLEQAVRLGMPGAVKWHLDRGADPNGPVGDPERRPLAMAAWCGHADVARVLLEAGAEVDARDRFGATALHEAADDGEVEVMAVLVEYGADVNAMSRTCGTPLHQAANPYNFYDDSSRLEAMAFLLEHGADIEVKDRHGGTALLEAARGGRLDGVKFLVERGADLHATGPCGLTVLHTAAGRGHVEIVEYLLSIGFDVNTPDEDGTTALTETIWSARPMDLSGIPEDRIVNVDDLPSEKPESVEIPISKVVVCPETDEEEAEEQRRLAEVIRILREHGGKESEPVDPGPVKPFGEGKDLSEEETRELLKAILKETPAQEE